MTQHSHRRFVCLFLTIFGIPALLVAILNGVIDPFDYFQSPRLDKFNAIKVSLKKQQRLHKAIEIVRQKPEVIFFGSSRLMAGLNPDDFTQLTGRKAYNAGFAGANLEEIYHYFEHALYHQPHLKIVVLGLDFFAFGKNSRPQKDFSLARLNQGTFDWKNRFSMLVSKAALLGSYETVKANFYHLSSPYFLSNGLYNPVVVDNPQNEYLVKGDIAYVKMIFENVGFYYRYRLDQDKIALFERLARRCREKGILLKVFFCPPKAVYWESLYRQGLWPVLEELKRTLSAIHPIWDFSGFNCATTQELEKDHPPLYYECSHFRPHLGKIILQKLFDLTVEPADFGYLLTPETVESSLEEIKRDRKKWLDTHPAIIEQLDLAGGI